MIVGKAFLLLLIFALVVIVEACAVVGILYACS